MADKKIKKRTLSVWLSVEDIANLDYVAHQEDRSRNAIVSKIIREGIDIKLGSMVGETEKCRIL